MGYCDATRVDYHKDSHGYHQIAIQQACLVLFPKREQNSVSDDLIFQVSINSLDVKYSCTYHRSGP